MDRPHHKFWPKRLPHSITAPATSLWHNLAISAAPLSGQGRAGLLRPRHQLRAKSRGRPSGWPARCMRWACSAATA